MNLTPTQTAALEAFVATLQAGTTSAPAPTLKWWSPSPADYSAFSMNLGVPVEAVMPWVTQPNGTLVGSPFPTLPPVTIKSEVLKYAGFGYRPNGRQALFTDTAFSLRRKKCDQLAAATTP